MNEIVTRPQPAPEYVPRPIQSRHAGLPRMCFYLLAFAFGLPVTALADTATNDTGGKDKLLATSAQSAKSSNPVPSYGLISTQALPPRATLALTNREEFTKVFSRGIARLEKDLSNSRLDPESRALIQRLLDKRKELLAYYQTNPLPSTVVRTNLGTNTSSTLPPFPQRPSLERRPVSSKPLPRRTVREFDTNTLPVASGLRLPASESGATMTNTPNLISRGLSHQVAKYQHLLENPDLDQDLRRSYELWLEQDKKLLADAQTNEQLWANVQQADESKDPERKARAEQELADYLSARLTRIDGKVRAPGTTLDAIMKEYKARSGKAK